MSAVRSPAACAQALRRFRLAKVVARPDSAAQPRSSEAVARRARRTHTAVERTRHINTLSLRFKLSRPHIIAREHREEEHTHKNKLHAQQASPHEDVNCSTDILIRPEGWSRHCILYTCCIPVYLYTCIPAVYLLYTCRGSDAMRGRCIPGIQTVYLYT